MLGLTFLAASMLSPATVYVSPQGSDQNSGSREQPLATLQRALASKAKTIVLGEGIYVQDQPLRPASGVTVKGQRAVITAAIPLAPHWQPYRDGIWKAAVTTPIDRVWLNGAPLHRARYPNFDPDARYLGGTAADALSPERVAKWHFPNQGLVHAMHEGLWGDQWFRIEGKDPQNHVRLSQPIGNNRPSRVHPELLFVENIFEELDAPGEWFAQDGTLYVIPPNGGDPNLQSCRISNAKTLLQIEGQSNVHFENLTFEATALSFLDSTEPLLRSDWTIARTAAILLRNTENCSFTDCDFRDLGGNGILANGKNRHLKIERCHFQDLGASAVCFVGDPKAVRNPLFHYDERHKFSEIDPTPGPATDDYPMECLVKDCLIEGTGQIERQSAGIQISMARRIAVKNSTIHDCPRAGINIGDGCWGGHLIEGCDVFDTVRETSDHGAFNSWGRDRYWGVDFQGKPMPVEMPCWDAIETTTLRGNRWQCAHGWDIDLDDGSTNYLIENNLCLEGGLKLREGYFRTARNNILVDNGLHLHVWYPNSGDLVERNLTYRGHAGPVAMPEKWGTSVDFNFVHRPGTQTSPATEMQAASHADAHSLNGDAHFVGEQNGDWRLAKDSPALQTGFKSFPLDRFGVQKGRLRELAQRAFAHRLQAKTSETALDQTEHPFLGGRVKNLSGISEISATGMQSETGLLVLDAPPTSALAHLGIKRNDVILTWDGHPADRWSKLEKLNPHPVSIVIWRSQRRITL